MKTLLETPLQRALDVVERLDEEEQAVLLDMIRQRRIERRRAEIAENARLAALAFKEGRAHVGTLDDLRRDLDKQS
jgi:hypothetical protein